jgi:hypothetical protein
LLAVAPAAAARNVVVAVTQTNADLHRRSPPFLRCDSGSARRRVGYVSSGSTTLSAFRRCRGSGRR